MTLRLPPAGRSERRAFVLAAIILVQTLSAMFFVVDIVVDLFQGGHLDIIHLVAEGVATIALVGGVAYLMVELRSLFERMDRIETGLRIARGEMADIIESFFDRWGLSPAEKDVALLLLKGFDNETIASLRGTATGTVRAQTTAIYSKAEVESRAQLVSIFLEELMAGDAVGQESHFKLA